MININRLFFKDTKLNALMNYLIYSPQPFKSYIIISVL